MELLEEHIGERLTERFNMTQEDIARRLNDICKQCDIRVAGQYCHAIRCVQANKDLKSIMIQINNFK